MSLNIMFWLQIWHGAPSMHATCILLEPKNCSLPSTQNHGLLLNSHYLEVGMYWKLSGIDIFGDQLTRFTTCENSI